jgi:hypothetical protein
MKTGISILFLFKKKSESRRRTFRDVEGETCEKKNKSTVKSRRNKHGIPFRRRIRGKRRALPASHLTSDGDAPANHPTRTLRPQRDTIAGKEKNGDPAHISGWRFAFAEEHRKMYALCFLEELTHVYQNSGNRRSQKCTTKSRDGTGPGPGEDDMYKIHLSGFGKNHRRDTCYKCMSNC